MRKYAKQAGPFCVQIELTEGCNLRCGPCGLQGIRAPKDMTYKYMAEETLRATMRGIVKAGWNPRCEFAMHGNPTLHPDYVGMIKAAREEAPRLQLMMTDNGSGLLGKPGAVANITALFDAGLNVLALDDYTGIQFVPKIRVAIEDALPPEIKQYEYPRDADGNPHRRHNVRRTKMLSFIMDLEKASKGTHAVITNHAGCGLKPLDAPLEERCAKPFRELGVRWDGSIAACCNDWRGYYKCGNVNETPIDEIWNGPGFGAAREILYAGRRKDIAVCSGCDYHTYRNGLLPDKMGKKGMHKPDAQTMADAAAAQAGTPYTAPALRPWEQGK